MMAMLLAKVASCSSSPVSAEASAVFVVPVWVLEVDVDAGGGVGGFLLKKLAMKR